MTTESGGETAKDKAVTHDRVRLRSTHPTLYRSILTFALLSVGMAVSYWFGPAPTFNPYDINRDLVAGVFALYGIWQIVFLNTHYLFMVRIGMAFAGVLMGAWGWANTFQVFAGKASWTLPLVFGAIGAVHFIFLTEAPVNPTTRRDSPESDET